MLRWQRFPTTITLPVGRRYGRYAYLFWRIRLPLWIAPAEAGWWVLRWPGIAVGLAAGILAEMVLSYRGPQNPAPSPLTQANQRACVSLYGPARLAALRACSMPPT